MRDSMPTEVTVKFQAMYREIVGKREIVQTIDSDSTLRDVLDALAKTYGKDFNDIIDTTTGQIDLDSWVMLNGRSVRKTDIKLSDNDMIYIGVPMGGG
jgi:MoaD family protein